MHTSGAQFIKFRRIQVSLVEVEDAADIQKLISSARAHANEQLYPEQEAPQSLLLNEYKVMEAQGRELYFLVLRKDQILGAFRIFNISSSIGQWGDLLLDSSLSFWSRLQVFLVIHEVIFCVLEKRLVMFRLSQLSSIFARDIAGINAPDQVLCITYGPVIRFIIRQAIKLLALKNSLRSTEETRLRTGDGAFAEQEFKNKKSKKKKSKKRKSLRSRFFRSRRAAVPNDVQFDGKSRTSDVPRVSRSKLILLSAFFGLMQRIGSLKKSDANRVDAPLVPESSGVDQMAVIEDLRRNMLYCMRSRRTSLPVLSYSSGSALVSILAAEEPFVSYPPSAPGSTPVIRSGLFPAIEARVFKSVMGMSCRSALVLSSRIHVPDYYSVHEDACIQDGNWLIEHRSDGFGVILQTDPVNFGVGIMLFASGASNWYHWLIEVLPKAFLAKSLPDEYAAYPLLVPRQVALFPTFRDSLEIFRGGREVKVIDDVLHHFEELVVIDPLVAEPMNLRPNVWPTAEHYSFNPTLLRKYRNVILDHFDIDADDDFSLIFLARSGGRRNYNQDELVSIAERHGFHPVYSDALSFREQVEIFSKARFIIGPSGAAFANTLFCQPGVRLLTWLIPQYSGFCSYTNLSEAVGSEIRYLFPEPLQPIESTFDGYSAGYRVDPESFDAAVKIMLESENF